MSAKHPHLLPAEPDVPPGLIARITADHDRFASHGLPDDLDEYLRQSYGLDMTGAYAGCMIRNPWGKASGQLSLNVSQIVESADAGLGLVVLKTVIARDPAGRQSMSAWAIRESRMSVEPIVSPVTSAEGWTVTWKGRGWWQSFEDYLELVRAGCAIGRSRDLLVVPSVKYHLPARPDEPWRREEYAETTRGLVVGICDSGVLEADAAGEGFLPNPGRVGPRDPVHDGARVAPPRARVDPTVGTRRPRPEGRAQAIQFTGGRRLSARDARHGPP